MRKIRVRDTFLTAIFALILVSTGHADWKDIPADDFEVQDPPAKNSETYKADFETLHRLQNTRKESDCALSRSQPVPKFELFFGKTAGILEAKEIEQAKPWMDKVFTYSDGIYGAFKSEYRRPRPYNTDKSIQPCIPKPPGNKAYPSGHATSAALGACVLAKLFPNRAKRLVDYGTYLGDLRVIVGVHHPSDVKAGQSLGQKICERLLNERDFQDELNELLRSL